ADAPRAPAAPGGAAPDPAAAAWRTLGSREAAQERIGRFELRAALGRGAFGEVWRGRAPPPPPQVAPPAPPAPDPSGREAERFFREACAAAQLQHPHIVPVYDAGETGGRLFIATKLIDGITLASWLKEHRPGVAEACVLIRTLAEALHYAHGQGI